MLQPSVSQEALDALAAFQAYAARTLLLLDLIGTFVFALSGAVAGVRERLDLFGVLVLSFAAASDETAEHYQFYPFMNIGHFALYSFVDARTKAQLAGYYR